MPLNDQKTIALPASSNFEESPVACLSAVLKALLDEKLLTLEDIQSLRGVNRLYRAAVNRLISNITLAAYRELAGNRNLRLRGVNRLYRKVVKRHISNIILTAYRELAGNRNLALRGRGVNRRDRKVVDSLISTTTSTVCRKLADNINFDPIIQLEDASLILILGYIQRNQLLSNVELVENPELLLLLLKAIKLADSSHPRVFFANFRKTINRNVLSEFWLKLKKIQAPEQKTLPLLKGALMTSYSEEREAEILKKFFKALLDNGFKPKDFQSLRLVNRLYRWVLDEVISGQVLAIYKRIIPANSVNGLVQINDSVLIGILGYIQRNRLLSNVELVENPELLLVFLEAIKLMDYYRFDARFKYLKENKEINDLSEFWKEIKALRPPRQKKYFLHIITALLNIYFDLGESKPLESLRKSTARLPEVYKALDIFFDSIIVAWANASNTRLSKEQQQEREAALQDILYQTISVIPLFVQKDNAIELIKTITTSYNLLKIKDFFGFLYRVFGVMQNQGSVYQVREFWLDLNKAHHLLVRQDFITILDILLGAFPNRFQVPNIFVYLKETFSALNKADKLLGLDDATLIIVLKKLRDAIPAEINLAEEEEPKALLITALNKAAAKFNKNDFLEILDDVLTIVKARADKVSRDSTVSLNDRRLVIGGNRLILDGAHEYVEAIVEADTLRKRKDFKDIVKTARDKLGFAAASFIRALNNFSIYPEDFFGYVEFISDIGKALRKPSICKILVNAFSAANKLPSIIKEPHLKAVLTDFLMGLDLPDHYFFEISLEQYVFDFITQLNKAANNNFLDIIMKYPKVIVSTGYFRGPNNDPKTNRPSLVIALCEQYKKFSSLNKIAEFKIIAEKLFNIGDNILKLEKGREQLRKYSRAIMMAVMPKNSQETDEAWEKLAEVERDTGISCREVVSQLLIKFSTLDIAASFFRRTIGNNDRAGASNLERRFHITRN